MLAWALWISFWLVGILKWGWQQFSAPRIWCSLPPRPKKTKRIKKSDRRMMDREPSGTGNSRRLFSFVFFRFFRLFDSDSKDSRAEHPCHSAARRRPTTERARHTIPQRGGRAVRPTTAAGLPAVVTDIGAMPEVIRACGVGAVLRPSTSKMRSASKLRVKAR